MAYQYEQPYLFDSTKFTAAFGFEPVSYENGIGQTAEYQQAGQWDGDVVTP